MRFHILTALLLGSASGAVAQGYVQPEIQTGPAAANPMGLPASSAIADLTARVDALERQLARLTGENEEAGHRIRQLEAEVKRLAEVAARSVPVEAPAPVAPAAEAAPKPAPAAAPSTGDAGEDAYLAGFRLWEAGKFADAQVALQDMAKNYPRHKRASYALNLAGRAYIDDGKPASAAKVLLSNYQTNPKGERAADSLYFLGQALVQLKKPAEACKVYDELADVYPNMREWLKQRLPKARQEAKCG